MGLRISIFNKFSLKENGRIPVKHLETVKRSKRPTYGNLFDMTTFWVICLSINVVVLNIPTSTSFDESKFQTSYILQYQQENRGRSSVSTSSTSLSSSASSGSSSSTCSCISLSLYPYPIFTELLPELLQPPPLSQSLSCSLS
jgi:hypothetical protein